MGLLIFIRLIRHSNFLSGLLLVCLMSFSPFTTAENSTVKKVYESAIFVPWQYLSDAALATQMDNGVAHINFKLNDIKLEAQAIPVKLSNIQVSIDTVLKNVGSDQGETLWQASDMAAHITINGFKVEKTVEQWYGSIKTTVKLSATCDSFEMSQSDASMDMAWGWKNQGTNLEASLSSLNISWPKNSWDVSAIRCQGPKGFGSLVQAEIQKQLQDPNKFMAPLKTYLQNYFNKKITASLDQYRKPQRIFSDFQTALVMEMTGVEAAVEKGLLLKGIIEVERLEAVKATSEEYVAMDVEKALENLGTDTPALVFPGLAAESLISDVAENRVAFYDLNRFEGFQKLLSNKFVQMFVWPDLGKYAKNAIFNVTSRIAGRPEVKYSQDHRMWISGYVDSWIYSNRDNRNWRYVDLRTGFAAWVTPHVQDGQITFAFSGQNMKSAAKMNDEYVAHYKARKSINIGTIEKAIKKAPMFQGFTLELPSIELKNGMVLKANRLIKSDKNAFIIELRDNQSEGVAGL